MNNKLFERYHVSGNEHKMRDFIKDEVKNCCDECYYDNFGNIIVRLKGEGRKVLFNTAIDTAGLLVTYVEDDGILRFSAIGNLSAQGLVEKMCISGEITGAIRAPKDAKLDELKINDLYIDLGLRSHSIKPGAVFALKNEFFENDESVFGTNLTVKANLSILIETIQALYRHPKKSDLYFAFTVQDQLGFKGAKVAANSICPDAAVILSYADCSKQDTLKWDGGAVVKIKDSVMIANRPFREQLEEILKDHEIPFQYEILSSGGAYNSQMMYLQDGILTFGISLPCKYYGSSLECIRKDEIAALQRAVSILGGAL